MKSALAPPAREQLRTLSKQAGNLSEKLKDVSHEYARNRNTVFLLEDPPFSAVHVLSYDWKREERYLQSVSKIYTPQDIAELRDLAENEYSLATIELQAFQARVQARFSLQLPRTEDVVERTWKSLSKLAYEYGSERTRFTNETLPLIQQWREQLTVGKNTYYSAPEFVKEYVRELKDAWNKTAIARSG